MLPRASDSAPAADAGQKLLFDISGFDLSKTLHGRDRIEEFIPHRGTMSFVDRVIWEHESRLQGIACKHVRHDEFWVPGHFPSQAMYPGVLMLETAAQFAAYLYKMRVSPGPSLVVFLRIDDVSFRNMVKPGDDLYILINEIKYGRRNFTTSAQGLVNGQIAFNGVLSGMTRMPESPSGS